MIVFGQIYLEHRSKHDCIYDVYLEHRSKHDLSGQIYLEHRSKHDCIWADILRTQVQAWKYLGWMSNFKVNNFNYIICKSGLCALCLYLGCVDLKNLS